MMHDRRLWWLMALACLGGWQWWQARPVTQPPGVLAPDLPRQAPTTEAPFAHGDYVLEPRAIYQLTARLLGRERYRIDAGASLSPLDFALGWGLMSRTEILDRLEVRQSNRFFHVRWDQPPATADEIMDATANVHLIPADAAIGRRLGRMRPGQVVHLRGLLVDAERADGWRWTTSLTRQDRGAGACELFYVQWAEVLS